MDINAYEKQKKLDTGIKFYIVTSLEHNIVRDAFCDLPAINRRIKKQDLDRNLIPVRLDHFFCPPEMLVKIWQ